MELYINVFVGFCMFAIGTLFGSFFSLATYRIPRHQDILVKRSYCPNCKHRLEFFDLIPVLSYIFHGAKCKYCGEKISPRYLLLELSNGIIFLCFYLIFGYTLNLLFVSLLYAVIFVAVGSFVMKSKMSDEEVNEVKKLKLKTKRGVYITEIVIALVLFILLLMSSFVMSRNYNRNNREVVARSNAVSLAIKNAEVARAANYDDLESYTLTANENGVNYNIEVSVTPFNEISYEYDNIAKSINVRVTYNIEGSSQEYVLDTVKGKVSESE